MYVTNVTVVIMRCGNTQCEKRTLIKSSRVDTKSCTDMPHLTSRDTSYICTPPRCQCTPTEPENTLTILILNIKHNEQQPFHATTFHTKYIIN